MKSLLPGLVLLPIFALACDETEMTASSDLPVTSDKIHFIRINNELANIPDADSLPDEVAPCLLFTEDTRDERRAMRTSGRRARGERNSRDVGKTHVVEYDVTEERLTKLEKAQLQLTLAYHSRQSQTDIRKLSVSDLFDETEGPFWYQIVDQSNGRLFTVTNIGQGDNPFEVVFEYGTLKAVAATFDGDLGFCHASVQAQTDKQNH